jgi:hypothetical protein
MISQSQKKILQAMACSADTPALEPLENHFDLVKDAVDNMQAETTSEVVYLEIDLVPDIALSSCWSITTSNHPIYSLMSTRNNC